MKPASASRELRIVYIDLAPGAGGSLVSLYTLVRGLDRRRVTPHVILRAANPYADRFRQLGIAVHVVAGSGLEAGGERASDLEPWERVRQGALSRRLKRMPGGEAVVHNAGFVVRTLPRLRRTAREIAAHLADIAPDLVHLNDIVCVSRAGIMAAQSARVPAICHLRAMGARSAFDRRLSRYLCGLICISRAVEAHQQRLGGRTRPCWVIYNAVCAEEFHPQISLAQARGRLGVGVDRPVVGCVGRLVPWKGQKVFVRALAEVRKEVPGVVGLIVGATESGGESYAQGLVSLVRDLGLAGTVRFLGFRDDVADVLAAMDLLAHTSVEPEPFGRVLIEAMASGVPVVGAHAGAVPEIIQDGITGRLVPPGDPDALAVALIEALRSPKMRQRWRAAAQRDVHERFGVRAHVASVMAVYERVLSA